MQNCGLKHHSFIHFENHVSPTSALPAELTAVIMGYNSPLNVGDDLELSCMVSGLLDSEEATYEWGYRPIGSDVAIATISHTSTLLIQGVRLVDMGLYSCIIEAGPRRAYDMVTVEVIGSGGGAQAQSGDGDGDNSTLIIGVVVAIVIVAGVVTAGFGYNYYKSKKQEKDQESDEREFTSG